MQARPVETTQAVHLVKIPKFTITDLDQGKQTAKVFSSVCTNVTLAEAAHENAMTPTTFSCHVDA
jgi:hypothetical protein